MVDQSKQPVVWLVERGLEWDKSNGDMERFWTIIHEGVHLQYAREAGFFDPKVYGPGEKTVYRYRDWRRIEVLGAVETLPPGMKLFGDRIRVGKFFLGPRCVEELLRGQSYTKEIWEESLGDWESFKTWFEERQQLRGDLYNDLEYDIRRAVRADYRDSAFHQRVWECACEYERRVSESLI